MVPHRAAASLDALLAGPRARATPNRFSAASDGPGQACHFRRLAPQSNPAAEVSACFRSAAAADYGRRASHDVVASGQEPERGDRPEDGSEDQNKEDVLNPLRIGRLLRRIRLHIDRKIGLVAVSLGTGTLD